MNVVSPHPLSLPQRLGVRLFRWITSLLGSLLRRLRPRVEPAAIERFRYGSRRDETLELIHPPRGAATREPVVYVHGGGWICGSKEMYTADLAFLSQRGHPVFNLDYPLAPEHPYPLPLRSLLHGLRWLRTRRPEPLAVHLMGDSAGGNLVMMLGLLLANPRLLRDLDPGLPPDSLPQVRSVISLYGVLDRLSWLEPAFPGSRLMLTCYGGRGAFEPVVGPELALTPLDLDFQKAPPCFLAVGTRDRLAESSRLAWQRLSGSGARVRFEIYEGERHGFFNMSWRSNSIRLRSDIVDFLSGLEVTGADDVGQRPSEFPVRDSSSGATGR